MAKHTTIQTFKSIAELKASYNLILPHPYEEWRLLATPGIGQIHAIPSMRGIATATNGILVLIINEQDQPMFGHIDNFVSDDVQVIIELSAKSKTPTKPSKRVVDIMEFV